MPTRQDLESALRNADKAGDIEAAKRLANELKATSAPLGYSPGERAELERRGVELPPESPIPTTSQQKQEVLFRTTAPRLDIDLDALPEISEAPELQEMSLQALQGSLASVLITDEIELAKTLEQQIPGAKAKQDQYGRPILETTTGQYAINKPGVSRQDLDQFLARLAAFTPAGRGLRGAALPTLGKAAYRSVATEAGLQAVEAGLGGEFSPEQAAIAGIFAPAGQVAGVGVSKLFDLGKRGIQAFTQSAKNMSEEGASTLLAEAMVREGLTPEQAAQRFQMLGDEVLLSDVGESFSRLLRLASNKVPSIQGKATNVLGERQAGQAGRVISTLEENLGIPSLNVDDEIVRLNTVLKPQIDELYSQAKAQAFTPSKRLKNLLSGDNDLARAAQEAEIRVSNRLALGEQVTELDRLDLTKQVLDDKIMVSWRQGEKGKASEFTKLKNAMVDEIDSVVPVYKQARDLYAGKAALENAADQGQEIFKLKPREVAEILKPLAESEKRMFLLGAKDAVIDKIDKMPVTSDAVKRIFGKTGDIKKLRSLFDSEEKFKAFSDAMEREARFVMTRRAAQANSTTAQQLFDEQLSSEALSTAREALTSTFGAMSALNKIAGGLLAKKGSKANIEALERAGDILLESGMKPERIQQILKRGVPKEVEKTLKSALGIGATSAAISVQ